MEKRQELEIRVNYSSTLVSCSICLKDDRLVAVMNDDYMVYKKEKAEKAETENNHTYS